MLELAQEMRTANLQMDGLTANAILMAHAMLRQWDKALTFFEAVRRRGIKPDVLTYNALITALANGGKKDRAMQVALSMEREGVAMDAGTETLVRALQADEWITGQEEIHVDEEGNLDLR